MLGFRLRSRASTCGRIYAQVYCTLYCVYDMVVKKVHVRYLICWWASIAAAMRMHDRVKAHHSLFRMPPWEVAKQNSTEFLPRVRVWAGLGVTCKTGDPKPLFQGSFTTILQLKCQYLSNKTHYRPTETETLNYEGSLQFTQIWLNLAHKRLRLHCFLSHSLQIFACRAEKPSINQSINQSIFIP